MEFLDFNLYSNEDALYVHWNIIVIFLFQDHQDGTEVFVEGLANSLQIEDLVPFFAR